jgi:hypothetical protein
VTEKDFLKIEKHLGSRTWRLNNLYRIVDESGQEVPFRLNWAQKLFYESIWFMCLILKARQLGFTTFACIFALDLCLFTSNQRCGIVAHNREDAEDFFTNKVRFAYDHLPEELKAELQATQDSARKLSFTNGSSIRVGTSLRSGTLNFLHVSEFGKICAKYPDKAREIVTGAFNTVHPGQMITVESTAEGRYGYFYDYCVSAQEMDPNHRTKMDFQFYFFPWWKHPGYTLDAIVTVDEELRNYFASLEVEHKIILDQGQKNWYAKKKKTQRGDMKREFPSTPEEAFEAEIEGSYYAKHLGKARRDKRVCRFAVDPHAKVVTGWDIGWGDATAIWFAQEVGRELRIIDYYENEQEDYKHYVDVLEAKGYNYEEHLLPHDIEHHDQSTGKTRKQVLQELGLKKIKTVKRTDDVLHGIEVGKAFVAKSVFHADNCREGIALLSEYQSEKDEKKGIIKQKPKHDHTSNCADAWRTLATGYKPLYNRPIVRRSTTAKMRGGTAFR